MTSVRLQLPAEVLAALDLPDEADRDVPVLTAAVDALSVVSNVVTVAGLLPQIYQLADALRAWAGGQARPTKLTIKGPGMNITVQLDRNVPRAEIVAALSRLLADDSASERGTRTEG